MELKNNTGIEFKIVILESDRNFVENLSDSLKLQVFRIIQEAIKNIEKHSKAHEASLILRKEGKKDLGLLVSDDGIGFDMKKIHQYLIDSHSHFGINGMMQRVKSLNGKISFNTEPLEGTLIHISIPCAKS